MEFLSPQQLAHLFAYATWADRIMLSAARTVPENEYYRDRGFSAGSIHKLLVHQMSSQRVWLSRWQGNPPTRMQDETDHPTRELLVDRWPALHRELLNFVAAQTPQSLATVLHTRRTNGEPFSLPLGDMLLHVADHCTYHRGQLNSMIKLAGGVTAYPSYQRYALEQRQAETQ